MTMTTDCIPVRKLHPNYTISVSLLNRDGTQPPAGTPEPSAEQLPSVLVLDEWLEMVGRRMRDKQLESLLWLSDNHPLLFEEVLCFIEKTLREPSNESIISLLEQSLVPEGPCTESYVLAYYRILMDTAPMLLELADEGFPSPFKQRVALSLFITTRTACGYTVEHQHYREALLAVWIMQHVHGKGDPPLPVKDHESDLAFINKKFDEVYELRHELRARNTIDKSIIEEMLHYSRPLRSGAL